MYEYVYRYRDAMHLPVALLLITATNIATAHDDTQLATGTTNLTSDCGHAPCEYHTVAAGAAGNASTTSPFTTAHETNEGTASPSSFEQDILGDSGAPVDAGRQLQSHEVSYVRVKFQASGMQKEIAAPIGDGLYEAVASKLKIGRSFELLSGGVWIQPGTTVDALAGLDIVLQYCNGSEAGVCDPSARVSSADAIAHSQQTLPTEDIAPTSAELKASITLVIEPKWLCSRFLGAIGLGISVRQQAIAKGSAPIGLIAMAFAPFLLPDCYAGESADVSSHPCEHEWKLVFLECPEVPCGQTAQQEGILACVSSQNNSQVDLAHCDDIAPPEATRQCSGDPCEEWSEGATVTRGEAFDGELRSTWQTPKDVVCDAAKGTQTISWRILETSAAQGKEFQFSVGDGPPVTVAPGTGRVGTATTALRYAAKLTGGNATATVPYWYCYIHAPSGRCVGVNITGESVCTFAGRIVGQFAYTPPDVFDEGQSVYYGQYTLARDLSYLDLENNSWVRIPERGQAELGDMLKLTLGVIDGTGRLGTATDMLDMADKSGPIPIVTQGCCDHSDRGGLCVSTHNGGAVSETEFLVLSEDETGFSRLRYEVNVLTARQEDDTCASAEEQRGLRRVLKGIPGYLSGLRRVLQQIHGYLIEASFSGEFSFQVIRNKTSPCHGGCQPTADNSDEAHEAHDADGTVADEIDIWVVVSLSLAAVSLAAVSVAFTLKRKACARTAGYPAVPATTVTAGDNPPPQATDQGQRRSVKELRGLYEPKEDPMAAARP